MHKRYAAIPVALTVLALALAGCSAGTSANNASGGKVTLTWEGFSGDVTVPPLIKQFEKENPGVTVKFTGLPYPQILTQISTQLVSGTAPDIVTVFPGTGNPIAVQTLAKNHYLADLTSQSWTKSFNTANTKVMGINGKFYMGANNFTIIPAIYNSQALAAVGATAPKTWSDVLSLCAAAKAKGKYAYAMAGASGGTFEYLPYALTATLVYGPNPDFTAEQNAGKQTFANSKWGEAFTKIDAMTAAGCFNPSPLGVSLDTAQGEVATGKAVGMVTVSNQISTIQGKAASGAKFETAAFPATNSPSKTYLPVGLGAGYGVNAKSKNLKMAEKFLAFFMSKEGVQNAIKSGSIFPSVPVGTFTHNATLDGVLAQAGSSKTVSFPDQSWTSTMGQAGQDATQKALGGASVSSVLADMDAAFKG